MVDYTECDACNDMVRHGKAQSALAHSCGYNPNRELDIGSLFECGNCGLYTANNIPVTMMNKVQHEGESIYRFYCSKCIEILYPSPNTPTTYANK